MPPMHSVSGAQAPTATHGPDVIVGDLPNLEQQGSAGTQVGLAVATTSCNNGDQPLDWFQLPNTDHPVIPQNLYRMIGGTDNTERFEQIGQSWLKHAFFALEDTVCSTCNTNNCQTGSHLCPGCSDPVLCRPKWRPKPDRFACMGQSIYRQLSIDGERARRPQPQWRIASDSGGGR